MLAVQTLANFESFGAITQEFINMTRFIMPTVDGQAV